MTTEDLQFWSNWITGSGVFVNAALTITIIWLTRKTVNENKRSADAAEKSAKSAKETLDISREMMELQKTNQQKMWECYRQFYGKQIVEYCIESFSALTNAFSANKADDSALKSAIKELDLTQENFFLYFDMVDIDALFNCIRDFTEFKKYYTRTSYGPDYDKYYADGKARVLMSEMQRLARVFDIPLK